jgi:hypothetical protein
VLDPALGYLISIGAALLFASASIHKIRAKAHFTATFAAHRVLPDGWAPRLAGLIPGLEAAIAVALLWPQSRRAASATGAVLLLAYAVSLSINLRRGRLDLDCGCGPAHQRRPIAAWMVWRNVALAGALIIAASPWIPRALSATDTLTVAGGVLVTAALYRAVDHLLAVVAPRGALLRSTS